MASSRHLCCKRETAFLIPMREERDLAASGIERSEKEKKKELRENEGKNVGEQCKQVFPFPGVEEQYERL